MHALDQIQRRVATAVLRRMVARGPYSVTLTCHFLEEPPAHLRASRKARVAAPVSPRRPAAASR
jgi:hypothetical protein